jgi:hypothetical protein
MILDRRKSRTRFLGLTPSDVLSRSYGVTENTPPLETRNLAYEVYLPQFSPSFPQN